MNKSANLSIRIDPEVKQNAEVILNELGLSMASAINMFLKQVTIHKGLPFDVKLKNMPTFVEDLTQEELINLLEEADKGEGIPFDDVKKELSKKYNL